MAAGINVAETNVIRVFGGNPAGDASVVGPASPSNANVSETMPVADTRRAFRNGYGLGWVSFQTYVDSAAGAGSTLTLFATNHPNPDLASDNDWQAVAGFTSVDMTGTGAKVQAPLQLPFEWLMLKAHVLVSTGTLRVFVKQASRFDA